MESTNQAPDLEMFIDKTIKQCLLEYDLDTDDTDAVLEHMENQVWPASDSVTSTTTSHTMSSTLSKGDHHKGGCSLRTDKDADVVSSSSTHSHTYTLTSASGKSSTTVHTNAGNDLKNKNEASSLTLSPTCIEVAEPAGDKAEDESEQVKRILKNYSPCVELLDLHRSRREDAETTSRSSRSSTPDTGGSSPPIKHPKLKSRLQMRYFENKRTDGAQSPKINDRQEDEERKRNTHKSIGSEKLYNRSSNIVEGHTEESSTDQKNNSLVTMSRIQATKRYHDDGVCGDKEIKRLCCGSESAKRQPDEPGSLCPGTGKYNHRHQQFDNRKMNYHHSYPKFYYQNEHQLLPSHQYRLANTPLPSVLHKNNNSASRQSPKENDNRIPHNHNVFSVVNQRVLANQRRRSTNDLSNRSISKTPFSHSLSVPPPGHHLSERNNSPIQVTDRGCHETSSHPPPLLYVSRQHEQEVEMTSQGISQESHEKTAVFWSQQKIHKERNNAAMQENLTQPLRKVENKRDYHMVYSRIAMIIAEELLNDDESDSEENSFNVSEISTKKQCMNKSCVNSERRLASSRSTFSTFISKVCSGYTHTDKSKQAIMFSGVSGKSCCGKEQTSPNYELISHGKNVTGHCQDQQKEMDQCLNLTRRPNMSAVHHSAASFRQPHLHHRQDESEQLRQLHHSRVSERVPQHHHSRHHVNMRTSPYQEHPASQEPVRGCYGSLDSSTVPKLHHDTRFNDSARYPYSQKDKMISTNIPPHILGSASYNSFPQNSAPHTPVCTPLPRQSLQAARSTSHSSSASPVSLVHPDHPLNIQQYSQPRHVLSSYSSNDEEQPQDLSTKPKPVKDQEESRRGDVQTSRGIEAPLDALNSETLEAISKSNATKEETKQNIDINTHNNYNDKHSKCPTLLTPTVNQGLLTYNKPKSSSQNIPKPTEKPLNTVSVITNDLHKEEQLLTAQPLPLDSDTPKSVGQFHLDPKSKVCEPLNLATSRGYFSEPSSPFEGALHKTCKLPGRLTP